VTSPARASFRPVLLALLIGFSAGAVCSWLKAPLPWLIGPLFACAFAASRGLPLASLPAARSAGQWVIGTALGLFFTADVMGRLGQSAGLVLAGLVWSVAIGLSLAWALRRYAGLDGATAFFAGAIGGASEMALQGERHGARVDMIAAAHSLRIMMVVSVVPFAFQWLDVHGTDISQRAVMAVNWWPGFPLLVVFTVIGALALRLLHAPNHWMIGPLVVSVVLSAGGVVLSAVPGWVVSAGQVFIGIGLGTRVAPGFFGRAPRMLAVVAVSTVAAIVASASFAAGLSWWSGVPWATLALATSPGGIAEMALTAKLLGLGVPVVTMFHLTRVLMLVLVGGTFYRWLAPKFGWPHDEVSPFPQARNPDDDDNE